MGRRLNPDEAAAAMRAAGLEPLEPYPGSKTGWRCICGRCGREVAPRFHHVRDGSSSGCKWCGDRAVDETEARALVAQFGLEPVGPFAGAVRPWLMRCQTCGHEFGLVYGELRAGRRRGCPTCAKRNAGVRRRRLESDARAVMEAAGLDPIEPYTNANTPWRSRCRKCHQVVAPTLGSIRRGTGCESCAGQVMTPERADGIMRAAGFEPLEPYDKGLTPWRCRCMTCGRESAPRLNSVHTKGTRCIYCAGKRVDVDEARAVMEAAGLQPIAPFPGSDKPWPCRCTSCGRDVSPSLSNIRHGRSCPLCAERGFKRDRDSIVYVLYHPDWNAYKVGVANEGSGRVERHARNGWQAVDSIEVRGDTAWAIERAVLRWWRDDLGLPPAVEGIDGASETVSAAFVTAEEIWEQVAGIRAELAAGTA